MREVTKDDLAASPGEKDGANAFGNHSRYYKYAGARYAAT